jgi:hypothetical protein
MVTAERFRQGMTLEQYLEQMKLNKGRFLQAMERVSLTAQERAALVPPGRTRNVLVITEDWCGTALDGFPALARMIDGAPDVHLRVFLRDANPDLMDQFLKHGRYRSIPVFVFFDQDMNEVARFTERAPVGTSTLEHLKALLRA